MGLRQASLFHYFPRKEDMLAELLDRTVEPALRFGVGLRSVRGTPAAALFLLIVNDLRSFCGHAVKLGWLYIQQGTDAGESTPRWAATNAVTTSSEAPTWTACVMAASASRRKR